MSAGMRKVASSSWQRHSPAARTPRSGPPGGACSTHAGVELQPLRPPPISTRGCGGARRSTRVSVASVCQCSRLPALPSLPTPPPSNLNPDADSPNSCPLRRASPYARHGRRLRCGREAQPKLLISRLCVFPPGELAHLQVERLTLRLRRPQQIRKEDPCHAISVS